MRQFRYHAALGFQPPPAALDFHDTQFFRERLGSASFQLPDPASILALYSKNHSRFVVFQELGLFVKHGRAHQVSIEEAQTMQAVRRAFSNDEIPIPELVGWRRLGDINFIYMSLVTGITMEDAWPTLVHAEKVTIANQLQRSISLLRTLKQPPGQEFIGSVSVTHIQDIIFRYDTTAGPYSSVRDFNNKFKLRAQGKLPGGWHLDSLRALLPDTSKIVFSHADLSLDNTMLSGEPGSRSVAAILDWGMSGWYPEYWEFCKMLIRTGSEEFETEGWLPQVLEPYDNESDGFVGLWQYIGTP